MIRILSVLIVLSTPMTLLADESREAIRVGLVSNPPFVVTDGGQFSGLAVELWEEAAKLNNWDFEYQTAGEDPLKAVAGLEENQYDILLGDISPTAELHNFAHFT